jgi:hypothetical protein
MRWERNVTHVEERNAYRISVGKPERKIPPGMPRHRWEDNIKLDLRDTEF